MEQEDQVYFQWGAHNGWFKLNNDRHNVYKDCRLYKLNRTSISVPVSVYVCVFGVYCKGLDIFAEQVVHHILRQQRLQLVDVTL